MHPLIILAPMEGVIDAITRRIYSRIGGFSRFVTEFIRVTDRPLPDSTFYRYCPELLTNGQTAEGTPVFVQLLGGRPEVVAENAARAAILGAPGIDLNFGCPAPTVNRNDGGATLLKNPHRVFDVVSKVRAAVPTEIEVSAKVRLGFSDKSLSLEIARAVASAGASRMIVHARTRDEGYKPPAHWEYIARMKDAVSIPVVANGDIWSVDDYQRCVEVSGCTDVALGRGAMAKPDLALQLRSYLAGNQRASHDWDFIRAQLLPDFIDQSLKVSDEYRVLGRTKQWLRFLKTGYKEADLIFDNAKRTSALQELRTLL